jgi:hypothetical protein
MLIRCYSENLREKSLERYKHRCKANFKMNLNHNGLHWLWFNSWGFMNTVMNLQVTEEVENSLITCHKQL